MVVPVGVRRVNDMNQQVGILQFLQRGLECPHQMVGQLGDKSDGIGQQHFQRVGHLQAAGGGVQGIKQPVIGRDTRAGDAVQQGRFTGVGVAHQGHHRDGIFLPPLPLDGPDLADFLQFLFQPGNAAADNPAVRLQLGLTGATGANGAFLPFQVGPHTRQTGQQIFILGQLHLQAALFRLGPLGENIKNQGAAVQNRDAQKFFQRPVLGRREIVVKNSHGGFGGLQKLLDLVHLALTDEAVGVGGVAVLEHLGGTLAAGRFQQRFQLVQGGVGGRLLLGEHIGVEAHQHGLFNGGLFRFQHKIPPLWEFFLRFFVVKFKKARTESVRALGADYLRPNFLLKRSTRPPVSTSFCLPV